MAKTDPVWLLRDINKMAWGVNLLQTSVTACGMVKGHCGFVWSSEHTAWLGMSTESVNPPTLYVALMKLQVVFK